MERVYHKYKTEDGFYHLISVILDSGEASDDGGHNEKLWTPLYRFMDQHISRFSLVSVFPHK